MGIINSILPISAMLLIGYFTKTYFITDKSFWSNVNKLVYYIMFPSLMIYSISKANFEHTNSSFVFVLITIVVFITSIIWLIKPRVESQYFWISFLQGSIKYNSYVFIGVSLYYLNEGVVPVIALITAVMVITTNVITVFVFNKYSKEQKGLLEACISTLKNPLIISCVMGLFINYAGNYIPFILGATWLNNILEKIGTASLVLSLIGVGASLKFRWDYHTIKGALYSSIIKLLIFPLIVLISLNFFNYDRTLIIVCVIYAASPCSSNATAATEALGGDHKSMSLIISLQTILSMVTISFWLALYQNGYI